MGLLYLTDFCGQARGHSSSEDLVEGATIRWRWEHYGENTAVVRKIVENELIELTIDSREWDKTVDEAYDVRVIFEFERIDDNATLLSINEDSWKTDTAGLKGSHDNCSGWTHMAMCLKGWLEHWLDLR